MLRTAHISTPTKSDEKSSQTGLSSTETSYWNCWKTRRTTPLIGILSEETNPKYEAGNTNPARKNFSFATKFCHYACFYIFENKDVEYRDSYSIYDYIVSNALTTYYGFEDIKPSENDSDDEQFFVEKYRNYQTFIDKIRDDAAKAAKDPNPISRNGFDHLLWYYYKGKGKNNQKQD